MNDNREKPPSEKPRILLVEDDATILALLQLTLERTGFEVDTAAYGPAALKKLAKSRYDLMITDLFMPEMDGFELVQRIRGEGLDKGAHGDQLLIVVHTPARVKPPELFFFDGHIHKPCGPEEFVAAVKNFLSPKKTTPQHLPSYTNGDLSIDFEYRIVTVRGKDIDLTPIEFELLYCLVRNEGRTLPHRYLLTKIWGPEYADEVDYLKAYIRYLRLKIEEDPSNPVYIQAEWGVGYRFVEHK